MLGRVNMHEAGGSSLSADVGTESAINTIIPVFKPLLESEEHAACQRALDNGWLGMGEFVGRFENAMADFLGLQDRHVVAVSTGHAALHTALLLAGVGQGDEVITPAFNNIADFQAILACGAEVVLCDVMDETACIDLDKAAELVSPKTKAIIVMDYGSHVCEHERAAELSARHGLRIIHDAAHAFGARYNKKMIGTFSDLTMFSFDPIKTITCIDGGAVIVQTPEEVAALHEMRLIGMSQDSSTLYRNQRAYGYDVKRLGFRYHMPNLHAAIGLAQLGKIDRIRANRHRYFAYYEERLADVTGLSTPGSLADDSLPFLYYVRVARHHRDDFRSYLLSLGVETGVHWQPGHWFQLLRECRRGDLSTTDLIAREIVSIPFHSEMSDATLERVVEAINSYFDKAISA